MSLLDRLFRRRAPVAAPAAPEPTAEPRRISQVALDMIGPAEQGAPDPVLLFAPAEPPKGVVPANVNPAMALDEAYGGNFADFAASSIDASAFLGATPWMGYPVLAELAQRAEYRRITETLAKQMTRKFIKLTSSGDEDGADERAERIEKMQNALEHFNVRRLFRKMAEFDGYYGRGHLYPDFGGADDPDENKTALVISKAKIRKGSLKGFRAIEPFWTYPANYSANNPLADNFYKPQGWYVMGQTVDVSRLLTFVGREVADILKPAYSFGGVSMTQLAKPYVDNWLRTRQSVADLLDAFSVMVLKTKTDDLTQLHAMETLIKRIEMFNRFRSNRGTFVVDKDSEDFANVSAPIAGLDKLQAQSQEQMAAVAGVPLVILLGITPSGLNASTDGEFRAFYDWVMAQQEDFFGPNLRKVLDIIQLHLFGDIDQAIGYEWVPLWELDAVQRATVRKTQADTAGVYIENGVITPFEERERLAREDESDYASLDLAEDPSEDLDAQALAEAQASAPEPGDDPPDEGESPAAR